MNELPDSAVRAIREALALVRLDMDIDSPGLSQADRLELPPVVGDSDFPA